MCALPIPGGAHLLVAKVLVLPVRSLGLAAAGLPIRRLSADDLAACVELAADRGWPPEQNKWRLLFAVGEAYGVDDPAGGRGLAGFAAAWRNEDDLVIGPLVAADFAVARTLITAVAEDENGSVRVDIRGGHLNLANWAAARGLLPCGSATLMVHGGSLPGERDKLFAPASGATG